MRKIAETRGPPQCRDGEAHLITTEAAPAAAAEAASTASKATAATAAAATTSAPIAGAAATEAATGAYHLHKRLRWHLVGGTIVVKLSGGSVFQEVVGFRTCPASVMRRTSSRAYLASCGVKNVYAMPLAPARPVRPMRWT